MKCALLDGSTMDEGAQKSEGTSELKPTLDLLCTARCCLVVSFAATGSTRVHAILAKYKHTSSWATNQSLIKILHIVI